MITLRCLLALIVAVALAACSGQAPQQSIPFSPSTTPASLSPQASSTASPTVAPPSPTVAPPSPTASSGPSLPAVALREIRADVPRRTAGDAAGPLAQRVVAGDTSFGLRLYPQLAGGSGNLIFSPYSISTALSMTLGGARGQTAQQLIAALDTGSNVAAWHDGRSDLDQWLQRTPPTDTDPGYVPLTIAPANALFGQDGLAFRQPFLDLLARDYGSGLQSCDFSSNPEACRAAINAWVAGKTADKIRELLARGTINSGTRFVLVNAILFKAGWAEPFDAGQTTTAAFHRLDGSIVQAPTMHGAISADVSRGDGWVAVDVPYAGASMTIIVPDAGRYADVEGRLDTAMLTAIREHGAYDLVHLSLPKWTSTTAVELTDQLRALGIRTVFGPSADLGGVADVPLSVAHVIHQATITVDEHGTEAAAATAIVGDTTGGGPQAETTVRVDRPFIYLIRDSVSGEILFAGRVLDPTAA